MIASAHAAAGIAAGMAVMHVTKSAPARIAAALVLGAASHLALDAIPHDDYGALAPSMVRWIVLAELLGVCLVAAWLVRGRLLAGWYAPLIAGFVGSTLPDAKYLARAVLRPHAAQTVAWFGDRFHVIHGDRMRNPALGVGVEIFCAIALLALLLAFPRTAPRGGPPPTTSPRATS